MGKTFVILIAVMLIFGVNWINVPAVDNTLNNPVGNNSNFNVWLPMVMKPDKPPDPPQLDFEAQVVALTNKERLTKGCGPVTMDSRLQAAADGHSGDMAVNDFFSHYSLDGTTPWERIRAQGYTYSLAGENIAAGYSTPEDVVNGWMNSSGHRANILNCGFIHIGVGYYYLSNDTGSVNYRHYWTQVFASP